MAEAMRGTVAIEQERDGTAGSLGAQQRGTWWQNPKLHYAAEDEQRERRVNWLELFFDLIFVVVIAELSHYLAEHPTLEGLLSYIIMFIPTWWIWIGGTIYNSRFETHDLSFRLFTFLQMIPVAGLALWIHDGTGELSIPFALTYAAARVIISLLWLRGGRHNPEFNSIAQIYAGCFFLSGLLFILSTQVPIPWRFGLWGLGLAIDLVTPLLTVPATKRLPRLSNSKLPERFGLFVIIVLGEEIVAVISGLAERESFDPVATATAALGFVLSVCLWWVYFDYIARRSVRRTLPAQLIWSYGHLPMLIGTVATSAAILNLVETPQSVVSAEIRWIFTGGMAVVLVSMAIIEANLHRDEDEPTDLRTSVSLKLLGAVVAIVLGVVGGKLGTVPLLLLLLVPLFLQMGYGLYAWFRTPEARPVGHMTS